MSLVLHGRSRPTTGRSPAFGTAPPAPIVSAAARSEIVLIGPVRAGKSTVASLIAEKIGVPRVSVEQHRWRYYAEHGYDRAHALAVQAREGFLGLYRYMRRFEAEAVRRVLEEHRDCVFDFGASHTVQDDPELFAIVQAALRPFANVVLLLPSEDPVVSVRVLNERTGGLKSGGIDFVEHFVRHRSGHALAKIRVYTEGKTPEQTRDEILERCVLGRALPKRSSIPPAVGPSPMEPPPAVDGTTWAQHRELACLRLPDTSGQIARVAREDVERVRRELERLRGVLDRPLCELSRRFVNDCFAEVDAVVDGALLKATIPEACRVRAARLYGYRLGRGATLRDVLALDPRDGVRPVGDAHVLALLGRPDAPPRARAAQRAALQERFLRRPQRSRYPFLHDVIVGHFVHALEGGGIVKERRDLRLSDVGAPVLAAHFVSALARMLGKPAGEIAALHFADNETIDRELSTGIRDLLVASAQVSAYLEPLVLHAWQAPAARLLGVVLLFFAIPVLERIAAGSAGPLRRDAGRHLSSIAGIRLSPAVEPNEADVVASLLLLADTLWTGAPGTDEATPPPAPSSGSGTSPVSLLVL